MPEVHAKLSASGASRWINCPPSVALEQDFENTTSSFAEEGTKAHEIAELKLTKFINRKRNKIKCDDKDMDEYTSQYRDYCVETYNKLKKKCKDTAFFIERRLDFSKYVPNGFGTGDCVIIADNELHIIDLKYGKGVEVSAESNPQLRLYGLGAVTAFELIYGFDTVVMHIMQPRKDNISTETLSVVELKKWAEEIVIPAAQLADKGDGDFNPSEDACRWCKAKAICKARANYLLALEEIRKKNEENVLSAEEVSEVLAKIDSIVKWAESVKDHALNEMLKGNPIEGYKVVEGRSNRIITDQTKVANVLIQNKFNEEMIYKPKELLTLTNLEKLVGKNQFGELAGAYIEKPAGKPTIAPASDKRKALTTQSAEEDFADLLL